MTGITRPFKLRSVATVPNIHIMCTSMSMLLAKHKIDNMKRNHSSSIDSQSLRKLTEQTTNLDCKSKQTVGNQLNVDTIVNRAENNKTSQPCDIWKFPHSCHNVLLHKAFPGCILRSRPRSHFKTAYQLYSTDTSAGDSGDSGSWEALVNYENLSPMEIKIHERHREAVKKRQFMYVDPVTGYYVMTRLAHLDRGKCCGNACRHCPFGQVSVTDVKNRKRYNSAFYV